MSEPEITKDTFTTVPEKQLWYLKSKSITYDEVAILFHKILDNQEKVRTYQNYFNWMEREGMPFQPPKEQEEKMRSIRQIEQENKDLKERIETDFATIKKLTEELDIIKHSENANYLNQIRQLDEELEQQTKMIYEITNLITTMDYDEEDLDSRLKAILEQIK